MESGHCLLTWTGTEYIISDIHSFYIKLLSWNVVILLMELSWSISEIIFTSVSFGISKSLLTSSQEKSSVVSKSRSGASREKHWNVGIPGPAYSYLPVPYASVLYHDICALFHHQNQMFSWTMLWCHHWIFCRISPCDDYQLPCFFTNPLHMFDSRVIRNLVKNMRWFFCDKMPC